MIEGIVVKRSFYHGFPLGCVFLKIGSLGVLGSTINNKIYSVLNWLM